MAEPTRSWQDGDFLFTEVIRQEYSNCCFSTGFVEGHPVDTLYFQAERDGRITTQLLLRPDEMAAIAWLANGVLWSHTISDLEEADAVPSCGTTPVHVRVPAELSYSGCARWEDKGVDACIADIVEALVQAGIYTSGCCCGHGKTTGNIILTDGRELEITLPCTRLAERVRCADIAARYIEDDQPFQAQLAAHAIRDAILNEGSSVSGEGRCGRGWRGGARPEREE